jgi:FixJ family two-component response regulator
MARPQPVIAVLDDEPEMRKALRRLLTCRNLSVEEYACGNDLLSSLDSHLPDCLLLDLHMPELNGFEVLEAIRAGSKFVPTIVITAHDEPGMAERMRVLGVSACFKKPIDKTTLFPAIEAAISSGKNHEPCTRTVSTQGKKL